MDLSKIQELQRQFILERRWERFNPTQVFSHLIEELGEVVSYFLYQEKYKVKGAGHEGHEDKIEMEIAQAFNLFLQLAIHANVDLEKAWHEEYERNIKRFDPNLWKKLADKDE